MPIGYLTSVAVVLLYTVLVLRAPRRPAGLARVTFLMTFWVNEYPFIVFAALAASTVLVLVQGDLTSAAWVLLAVAAATVLGLVQVVRRASLAGRVVEKALADPFGNASRAGDRRQASPQPLGSLRVLRDIVAPFPVRPRGVLRIRNLAYGDAGKRNLLDVYRRRDPPAEPGPVLIYFHGGHFQIGRKSREALPLLYRMANEGWLCISANYRLHAAGRFPNSLIDAKSVIAWARMHAPEHGADGSLIVVAGGSAGGHLASMAALSPNHPAFQPAGPHVDSTVAAAICLYGYYGRRMSSEQSSPEDYLTSAAPPFLVAHGDNDNQIDVRHADRFVERLRSTSEAPVVYFRLPGAQHSFDLFRSLRFDHVTEGIVAFLGWVRSQPRHSAHDLKSVQLTARER